MSAPDLFARVPDHVSVYEVSPRDGLQNEVAIVPPAGKLRLIDALVGAGLERIEFTSFVSPKWVPHLADAEELAEALQSGAHAAPGVRFSALCANARGLERAKKAGVEEISLVVSASETHNRKNINKTIEATLAEFEEMIASARGAGMRVRGYVSTAWGCPYEGDVDPARAIAIARELHDRGCYQVSLGDTIGAGTPRQTSDIVTRALGELPVEAVAMHMHDTRGSALPNIVVGLELGVRHFDASVGGMGGCPYAPGAAGNVATEDLVYMLHGMGIATGLDVDRLADAASVAESLVGHPLPGKVHQAAVRRLRGRSCAP